MKEERRLEYLHPSQLEGKSSYYFMVPRCLIQDSQAGSKRITIFSFLSIRRGLDKIVTFTINGIAKWMGKTPNRNPNGVNNKIMQLLRYLQSEGYVSLPRRIENTMLSEAEFNIDTVKKNCEGDTFAILYVDEVEDILHYKIRNKENECNRDVVLLVFAWLRMRIYRRPNRMRPEEMNCDDKDKRENDIANRRKLFPEAYDCYYKDIAKDVGISERLVSKAVAVLNGLELIYSEPLPRSKNDDGDWRTEHIIFCNYYKREKESLLAFGEDYYSEEVESKKNLINAYKKKPKK